MTASSTRRRPWIWIALLFGFLLLSFLPLIAEKPFPPQETSNVILSLLQTADLPYVALAPVFHIVTLLLIGLILRQPGRWGRLLAAWFGLDYLVLIVTGAQGRTEAYGYVVMTGALILYALLGILWLASALRGTLSAALRRPTPLEWVLLLFALLAFWGPYAAAGAAVRPDFNPLRLITSPDFGMTFCFTTPVFLMLAVLCRPGIPGWTLRITALNGILYGLFNLTHWFYPERWWMGFLHLPLLLISLYAMFVPLEPKAG
jgi:hypothetical protein